jgi:hypothetical protein
MLLQAWDTSGNLKWTRTWGGDQTEYGQKVVLADGGVFLCGTSSSFGSPVSPQAIILRFSESGSLEWQRMWGGDSYDECFSACLIPTLFGDPTIALAGHTASFGAGQMDLLYLRFDLDGNLGTALTWGDGDVQTSTGIASSFVDDFVVGWKPSTTHGWPCASQREPQLARYDGGVGVYFNGVANDAGDLIPGLRQRPAISTSPGGSTPTAASAQHVAKGRPAVGQCPHAYRTAACLRRQGRQQYEYRLAGLSASVTDRTAIAWEAQISSPVLSVPAQSLSILPPSARVPQTAAAEAVTCSSGCQAAGAVSMN